MQKAAGVFLETKHLHSFVVRCPLLPAACELREDCNLSARCRSLFYREVLFEVAEEEGIADVLFLYRPGLLGSRLVDDGHGGDYVNVDINVNVNTDENVYNRN